MQKHRIFSSLVVSMMVFSLVALAGVTYASHSWGGYHWARTANPFNLKLGDNVSSAWDSYLGTTSSDWSKSIVLDTTVVSGGTLPRTCKPISGRVEVCSNKYGKNGWLGVASIWINSDSHITQGTVKMNDSYFAAGTYNTPAWRNLVMCQEVGHTLGLDHQDEDFNNPPLGTCMDYTNDPTPNQHPNQHDYDQLEAIYAHLDSTSTIGQSLFYNLGQMLKNAMASDVDVDSNQLKEWGTEIKKSKDGKGSLYVRNEDGQKVFTFVVWADSE